MFAFEDFETVSVSAWSPFVRPKPVTLADLGTVELDEVAVTGYGRTNGQPALTLTVSKTSDANTVEVADAVQAKLTEIAGRHSAEMTVTTVQDLSGFIKESRDGLLREGGLGAVFAILTIFLFLLSLRATIVAAISIPLSILTALVIMQITGVTINILTLGGLAVAVGRVVDDAIVVLENIYRHRALGEDRRTAAINGPREVAGAITASTLTTVAVFLPLGFVGGLVSQFFLQFALTVTFALLASLVCALTVVPVLGYFLLDRVKVDVDANGEPVRSIWVRAYTPIIQFVLRSRWTKVAVVVTAMVLFFASAALAPQPVARFLDEHGQVLDGRDRHLVGVGGGDLGQLGLDRIGDLDRVGVRCLGDGQSQRRLAVRPSVAGDGDLVELDRAEVSEGDRLRCRRRGGRLTGC